jgi:hypothetical protein
MSTTCRAKQRGDAIALLWGERRCFGYDACDVILDASGLETLACGYEIGIVGGA